jgi:DNA-binding IclR family transcriptional regulator
MAQRPHALDGGQALARPRHAIGKVLLSGLPDAEGRRRYAGRRSLERRTDATVTSVGALLTQLAAVREQGCAFDTAELEPGLHCIAAPVRDHAGAVIAAAGISGPADRITDGTRPTLGASVRTAAEEISARMGAPNTGSSPA